jgi:hypothetical protein
MPNNLKVFGSNKTKGHKLDSQNRQRSPMSEGGESTKITYVSGRRIGKDQLCLKEENRQRSPMSEGGDSAKITYF